MLWAAVRLSSNLVSQTRLRRALRSRPSIPTAAHIDHHAGPVLSKIPRRRDPAARFHRIFIGFSSDQKPQSPVE
jgi:hypothetical protein